MTKFFNNDLKQKEYKLYLESRKEDFSKNLEAILLYKGEKLFSYWEITGHNSHLMKNPSKAQYIFYYWTKYLRNNNIEIVSVYIKDGTLVCEWRGASKNAPNQSSFEGIPVKFIRKKK